MAMLRLTLAPFPHHSLVRQEHDRTIPLAVVEMLKIDYLSGYNAMPNNATNRVAYCPGALLEQWRRLCCPHLTTAQPSRACAMQQLG
jgi:hypothetical protein